MNKALVTGDNDMKLKVQMCDTTTCESYFHDRVVDHSNTPNLSS